jgi:hypothetical protein
LLQLIHPFGFKWVYNVNGKNAKRPAIYLSPIHIYIYILFKSTVGFVSSTYPTVDLKKIWMRNGELTFPKWNDLTHGGSTGGFDVTF